MSYYLEMAFHRATPSTVLSIINEYKKWYWKDAVKILEDNSYYIPSLRYNIHRSHKLSYQEVPSGMHCSLEKRQMVSLTTRKFLFGVGYNFGCELVDVDTCVFLFSKNGKCIGQLSPNTSFGSEEPSGVCCLSHDHEGCEPGFDELFSIDLDKISASVTRIAIVANNQSDVPFSKSIINAKLKDDNTLCEFSLQDNSSFHTIVLAELYQEDGSWYFGVVNDAICKLDDRHVFEACCSGTVDNLYTELDDARDKEWLYSVMMIKFVYWKKYNLLGVVGSGPDGWHSVGFQNSCDQDYEFSEWPKLKFFKDIISEITNMSDAEIIEAENLDEDDDVDYWRRSRVYSQVFKKLGLNEWLYSRDNDDVPYICLNESCIDDYSKQLRLMNVIRKIRQQKI